jgi:hypothetical protein
MLKKCFRFLKHFFCNQAIGLASSRPLVLWFSKCQNGKEDNTKENQAYGKAFRFPKALGQEVVSPNINNDVQKWNHHQK